MNNYNPAEDIITGKDILEKFRKELPGRIKAPSISNSSKIPYQVSILRAALFYRVTELSETAIELYEEKRLISAFIITRCVHETVAVFYWLFEKLSEVVNDSNIGDFDDFIRKLLFGWKIGDDEFPKAYNILTAIDKLNKKIDTFRAHYGWLSEFCHPNYSGVYGAYGRTNYDDGCVDFTSISSEVSPKVGLSSLIASLDVFKHLYDKSADLLPRFVEIYENETEKRGWSSSAEF